jgi:hypothetical protein
MNGNRIMRTICAEKERWRRYKPERLDMQDSLIEFYSIFCLQDYKVNVLEVFADIHQKVSGVVKEVASVGIHGKRRCHNV